MKNKKMYSRKRRKGSHMLKQKLRHKFMSPPMRVKGFGARIYLGKRLWRDATKSDLIKNPHGKWTTIWTTRSE